MSRHPLPLHFLQLYVAYTRISNGMVSDPKYSAGQAGDVNMPENRCGAVFAYPLDREYTANHAKVRIVLTQLTITLLVQALASPGG